jgi:hypothetical protein
MKGTTWPWSWGEEFKLAVCSGSWQVEKGSKGSGHLAVAVGRGRQ